MKLQDYGLEKRPFRFVRPLPNGVWRRARVEIDNERFLINPLLHRDGDEVEISFCASDDMARAGVDAVLFSCVVSVVPGEAAAVPV